MSLNLLLKNLSRNKIRTSLTAMAVIVLVAIYCLANTVTATMNGMVTAHSVQTRLIVREKWVMPSRFPIRHVPKVAAAPGVLDWTVWHFYIGYLNDAGNVGMGFATRLENLTQMHAGLEDMDPALVDAMKKDKSGALVGKAVMDSMNWKVGQRFTVRSLSNPGHDLPFTIVGVIPSELWTRTFFFREDYYQDGTGDKEFVNVMWLQAANEEAAKRLAAQVEGMFKSGEVKLRVETEASGANRVVSRNAAIINLINFVVAILLVDMVFVLSNSISMTVRERRKEMAILKALGFRPIDIVYMVVGEAMIVGVAAGFLGAGTAHLISVANAANLLPAKINFLLLFPVPAIFVLHGAIVGALVSLLGAILPAWRAQSVKVVDVFSSVG
jgi:putative ABC transport system permease protein